MERGGLGGDRCQRAGGSCCQRLTSQGARLQDKCAVEDGGRWVRLPRDGWTSASHSRRSDRRLHGDCSARFQQQRSSSGPGGTLHGQSFTIPDFYCLANGVPDTQFLAKTQSFTASVSVALTPSETHTLTESETSAAQEHVRRAGEPMGLQLLWWQIHLQPGSYHLQLFQMHPELLDQRQGVCG
jgi:hypothetical protein